MKKWIVFPVIIIFVTAACNIQDPVNLEAESAPDYAVSAITISDEVFKNEVPEEDIAEFRAIQREIAAQYPLVKSQNSDPIQMRAARVGVNPTETEIIEAFKTTYIKYNIVFGSAANERFKFDIYGDWSLNFGLNGVQSGADIPAAANSTYDIVFNDKTRLCTLTKK